MTYQLFTDGSCLGNPGPGGWGAVLRADGEEDRDLSGGESRTTNNRMEMTAVIRGLDEIPIGAKVLITSDSSYVINTMTRGWKRKVNHDLWAELDRTVGERNVSWEWVRGHTGHVENERADRLAVAAAEAVRDGRPNPSPSPDRDAGRAGEPKGAADNDRGTGLTHLDESGAARMVDVSAKPETERVAVAAGSITMQPETLALVRSGGFEKGDVLAVARIAGVMAAKNTSQLIPLCHPLPLTQVVVEIDDSVSDDRIEITATAKTTYKTGVEMEALTAVSVAALTIYDMCKAVDRGMRIGDVRLLRKSGGKSGDYVAE
ncbi:MAG: cyclic pyranopterin monophosphate synthase MoaC [Chloroflexi bacterium]|nr:cyclic pyranopterin monophosphate synthase MoaC [Chloroflexota bacterium]